MANPTPDLYTIRVSARAVDSPTTKRLLSGTLRFDVSRRPADAKGRATKVDPYAIIVRPGDSVQFELGEIPFKSKDPDLRINWKFPTGKRWKEAPKRPGKAAQIPPKSGLAGTRFTFNAKIDLNTNIKLPAQSTSRRGTTVIQLDPDVVVDEC